MTRASTSRRFLAAAVLCTVAGFWLSLASNGQQTTPAPATATGPASITAATTSAPAKTTAPASVADLLKAAQQTFDAAATPDWTAASKQFTTLQAAMKKLKADLPKPAAEQQRRITQMTSDIAALNTAIKGKKQQAAMMRANRIIRVGGVLADTFVNKVPQNVWQMQYLAREIEVWSASPADLTKLKALPARFDTEWATINKQPSTKLPETLTKEYADENAKIKAAPTTEDFAKLAKPLLQALLLPATRRNS